VTISNTDTPIDLNVRVAGMDLASPIILASGTWGYAVEVPEVLEQVDFSKVGGVALKGIFYDPRRGNPTPRLVETPGGLLNAIGLEGVGVKAMVDTILPSLQPRQTRIIINICGTSVEEYARVTKVLVDSAFDLFDAIEVNISCPNLDCGGMEFGTDPRAADEVTRAVRSAAEGKPVLVKLAPLVTDIREIALAVAEAGANALSLVNTYPGMVIDLERRRPVLAKNFGGVSGPAIKPLAQRAVCLVHQALQNRGLDTGIVGMGGICSGRDALEYIVAGADAVSLGTVNFTNPLAYETVLRQMQALMRERYLQTSVRSDLSLRSWKGSITMN